MRISIYTDGSAAVHSTKMGGWAYLCVFEHAERQFEFWDFGHVPNTTSNRMELTAIIKALQFVFNTNLLGYDITIYSDSKYCVKGATTWVYNWEKNNYKDDTVKNRDLWEQLYKLIKMVTPKFEWVKSHNGNVWNERVDRMAVSICERGGYNN